MPREELVWTEVNQTTLPRPLSLSTCPKPDKGVTAHPYLSPSPSAPSYWDPASVSPAMPHTGPGVLEASGWVK